MSADEPANADPAALREAGLARLKTGDVSRASVLLALAAAADPKDPGALLGLGVASQRAGAHAEALEALARAESLRPDEASAPLFASISLLALGRPDAARLAAERALARAPDRAEAHVMRGRAWLALGEPARAEQAFAAALGPTQSSADIWRLVATARRARGDEEGAKAAATEASRREAGRSSKRATSRGADPELNPWRPTSAAAALGLAVEYLSLKPAFAALPFGEWSQVLFHQVARGHYLFIVDREQRLCGFLGWTLSDEAFAERWVEGRAGLVNDTGFEGDCVIVNAWAADSDAANRALRRAAGELFGDRRALYFKRHYADGRNRPMRLAVPQRRRKSARTPHDDRDREIAPKAFQTSPSTSAIA